MKGAPWMLGLMAALVLAAGTAHAWLGFGKYAAVEPENGRVVIPADDVSDGAAHYYHYKKDGRDVKFFVLKSSDGVIRAAFDACDVCWREGKGYSQEGDFMVCNNCGQRFHSARINEVRGGCNPAPLDRAVEHGDVVISEADILAGAGYFR
ncbi:DUF2318 domain-containing protein [Pseudodesulfovibrio sp.]|uniref:DUF2318 domain-containing protein n=1 Tax=Pseudodesulfovibrio sp. TaxID=2035812 RepID=UPI00261A5CD7|nr:DUF2318 domain-containing protein [Pseudodesulfovibrio sp.]MDD3312255.1 DUF2318 domain-containing protein [Pseudodesulfovibrio sp.]